MIEFVKHVFKLQFLLITLAILAGVYYPAIVEKLKSAYVGKSVDVHYENGGALELADAEKLFTRAELAEFNGENDRAIYLALLGRVYDVTKGAKHYGPGCGYNFFVGRDASVSFITGEFESFVDDEADDVIQLKPNDLIALEGWQKFYEKDYVLKGKLIGRFYDAQGQPTKYFYKYIALLDVAKEAKANQQELRAKYPDCNIEWSAEKGSHVWCTENSGGRDRSWVGYPRRLFEIGSDNFRCACLRENDLDTTEVMIKPYDNCEKLAHECFYNVD